MLPSFVILSLELAVAVVHDLPQSTGNAANTITLREAVELAVSSNPELDAEAWNIPLSEARTVQAGLRPNPDLSVEVEGLNAAGGEGAVTRRFDAGLSPAGAVSLSGGRTHRRTGSGFLDEAEVTVRLSQVIELGGKRAARIAAAKKAEEVAAWDYEVARYRVAADAARRFMAVLAAQERLRLAQEAAELGGDLAQAVEAQVEAGRVSPIEGRRARAKRDGLRIAARGLRGDLEQARLFLARTWGGASAGFGRAVGATDALPQLQPLDVLLARRESLPSLKRWGAELARRDAAVELAESNGIPDLTMTLGYRAERRSDDYERSFTAGADGVGIARASTSPDNRWAHSLVLEGSIPLPLFDRNQGRRRVAELEVGKGTDERAVADARIVATLTRFHAAARAARDQAQAIAERVLPELEKTLALTLEGYERGRFDYLAVLDAEEALNGARLQALEARLSYHETVASIEALFGASIATSPDDPGTRKGTNSKTLTVEEDL